MLRLKDLVSWVTTLRSEKAIGSFVSFSPHYGSPAPIKPLKDQTATRLDSASELWRVLNSLREDQTAKMTGNFRAKKTIKGNIQKGATIRACPPNGRPRAERCVHWKLRRQTPSYRFRCSQTTLPGSFSILGGNRPELGTAFFLKRQLLFDLVTRVTGWFVVAWHHLGRCNGANTKKWRGTAVCSLGNVRCASAYRICYITAVQ